MGMCCGLYSRQGSKVVDAQFGKKKLCVSKKLFERWDRGTHLGPDGPLSWVQSPVPRSHIAVI